MQDLIQRMRERKVFQVLIVYLVVEHWGDSIQRVPAVSDAASRLEALSAR